MINLYFFSLVNIKPNRDTPTLIREEKIFNILPDITYGLKIITLNKKKKCLNSIIHRTIGETWNILINLMRNYEIRRESSMIDVSKQTSKLIFVNHMVI